MPRDLAVLGAAVRQLYHPGDGETDEDIERGFALAVGQRNQAYKAWEKANKEANEAAVDAAALANAAKLARQTVSQAEERMRALSAEAARRKLLAEADQEGARAQAMIDGAEGGEDGEHRQED